MALADFGSQIPVIRRETISQLKILTLGQIKIQGIFNDPVTANIVTLQVERNHKSGNDLGGTKSYHTPLIPVMFAVTELMAPGCDVIIPTDVATELHVGSLVKTGATPRVPALTIANNSVVKDNANVTLDTGTNKSNTGGGKNVVDNVDNPLYTFAESERGDTQALRAEQKSDQSFRSCWRLADQHKGGMVVENGILYHNNEMCGHAVKPFCVPVRRRYTVMRLAHESNHLAGKKTLQRIKSFFYWRDIKRQVYQYCGSCKACQLHARAKKTDRVLISPTVRPTLPFTMCHMDCVGPIEPAFF